MIEQMNIEPNVALEAFNRARGHSMEKYTEDLLKRKSLSANAQSNFSLINSASSSSSTSNNNVNGDQIQWPTLYSTIENMSLDERRMQKQKQQKSQQIRSSTSMQHYNDQTDRQQPRTTSSANIHYENNPFKPQGHGRTSYHQQNPIHNNFYRQTSVTPRILNSSYNDDQHSNQSLSAYFGSGSNVGRGRPMTGDH